VQALFLAPLFVWYEVLLKMGFYKGLQRAVEVGVEKEVEKLTAGGEEMSGEEETEVCGIWEYIWDDICEVT
jgi:hypothetical protein